ncbi:hypothetical protein ACE6H2_027400 [Prunus campanulata]
MQLISGTMDPDSNLPPANMRIIVLWSGTISTLEIPVATRIIEVKLLIWEALHVPVPADRQELSWEGQFLKDELTLQNYHIPPNASLTVFNKIEVKIYLEYSRFHFVYVVYDGTTVGELKAKLHADQGIDIEHKTSLITFLWSGGESILLVPMATRIIDVKLLISEVLHIPVPIDRQELSWEGQCLKDELTLQDYHIPPTAFLVIYKKIEVEIYLEFDGIRYVYVVFDGITVGELKAKLQTEQGVDIEHKVLWMMDNGYLDDHAQLLVAGVVEGAKLFLIEDKKRI